MTPSSYGKVASGTECDISVFRATLVDHILVMRRSHTGVLGSLVDTHELHDQAPSEQVQAGAAPLRALVIEDCEADYDLLLLKIEEAGFSPIARRVGTLAELEDALMQDRWQVVFSGYDLPGFDGFRALQMVRACDDEIPFFIISGVIDEEQAVAAIRAGAQDFFFRGRLTRLEPALRRELAESEQREHAREGQAAIDRGRTLLRNDRIRFMDVLSHEFRTPLDIIHAAAHMLVRYGGRMDEEALVERVAEIQSAVERMTRLIDRVLLTGKLEMSRCELHCEELEIAPWCDKFLVRNFTSGGQRSRIRVDVLDVPRRVAMDSFVLEIALQNLLSNALMYSRDDLPVDFAVRQNPSGGIRFTVRDYGIGIPTQELQYVFTPFYRGSNVGVVPGTGLGLALVKACANVHGGTIEISSEQANGTYVMLLLPDLASSQ